MSNEEIATFCKLPGTKLVEQIVDTELNTQRRMKKSRLSHREDLLSAGYWALARYMNIHHANKCGEGGVKVGKLYLQIEREVQDQSQRTALVPVPKRDRAPGVHPITPTQLHPNVPCDVDPDTYERCKDWIFDNCHSKTCRDIVRVRVEHFESPDKPDCRKFLSNTATAKLVGVGRKEIPEILAPLEDKVVKKFRRRK